MNYALSESLVGEIEATESFRWVALPFNNMAVGGASQLSSAEGLEQRVDSA